MTPEGSQSLEELQNVDESQSAAPSSSNSNVQIRVKDVSEINSNEAEANPSPPTKRKLPSWMLASAAQQSSDSIKKRRILSKEIQDASTSSAVDQPESTEAPSTSRNCTENDADQSASTSHATNEENVGADADTDANSVAEPKTEEERDVGPSGSNSAVVPVKIEPNDEDDSEVVGHITPTSPRDIKPAVKVEKEEATSSTTRISCKFGIRCYRQNPIHRCEEAHPGDKDYQRPDFPAPPDGTPSCPYGDLCYRRNPVHFQQFSHPPSTDFQQNWKNYKMRLRQRKQPTFDPNASYSDLDDDEDDYDGEDPFIDDNSDDEFLPNTEEDDEDDFV